MTSMLNVIYNIILAFCFGSLNSIVICLIKSKGIQQGFLIVYLTL